MTFPSPRRFFFPSQVSPRYHESSSRPGIRPLRPLPPARHDVVVSRLPAFSILLTLGALLSVLHADPAPPAPDYALQPTADPAIPLFALPPVNGQPTVVTALDGVSFSSASNFGGDPDLFFPTGSAGWVLGSPDFARDINGAFSISFWAADVPHTGVHPVLTLSSGFDLGPPDLLATRDSGDHDSGSRFIDLNGDGFVDFVRRYKDSEGGLEGTSWINTGSGWVESPAYTLPKELGAHNVYAVGSRFADLDADGLPDFLYAFPKANGTIDAGAWRNTGSGWVAVPGFNPPINFGSALAWDRGVRVADLDQDGLPDLISGWHNGTSGVRSTYLAQPDGTFAVAPTAFDAPVSLGRLDRTEYHGVIIDWNGRTPGGVLCLGG